MSSKHDTAGCLYYDTAYNIRWSRTSCGHCDLPAVASHTERNFGDVLPYIPASVHFVQPSTDSDSGDGISLSGAAYTVAAPRIEDTFLRKTRRILPQLYITGCSSCPRR